MKYSIDDILGEYKDPSAGGDDLEDILKSYPATKSYDADLAGIFETDETAMSVSDLNITPASSYPSAEEIRRKAANITLVPDEELSPEDRLKKQQQINYEIISGDYDRLNVPDELKTSIELEAERLEGEAAGGDAFDDVSAVLPQVSMPDEEYRPDITMTEGSADISPDEDDMPADEARPFDEDIPSFDEMFPETKKKSIFSGFFGLFKKKEKTDKKFGLDLLGDIQGVHSEDEDDDFEKKYGNGPLFTEDEREELIGEHKIPSDVDFEEDQGHSLSEKMELDEYSVKYSGDKDLQPVVIHKEEPPPQVDDPFDKYADLDKINELDLDSILAQYETPKKTSSEQSGWGSISDMVGKLIAHEDDGEVSELGSKKVRPIERPKVSDVDLGLSGKILPDTASFKITDPQIKKIRDLKKSREEKVKNFKIEGFGDDEEEDIIDELDQIDEKLLAAEAETEEPETIDDFSSLNDAPAISQHIDKQKNELLIRLLILAVCFAVSVYIAIANDLDLPVLETFTFINKHQHPDSFLTVNTVVGMIAGAVCLNNIFGGVGALFRLKPNNDSLSAMALVTSLITSLFGLMSTNVIRGSYAYVYMPVAIGALIFNTIGKLLIVSRTRRGFANITADTEHYALFCMKEDSEQAVNFTRGAITDLPRLAGMHKTELITNFLKNSYATDSTDGFCRRQTPVIAALSVILGVVAGFMGRVEHGSMGAFGVGLSVCSAVWAVCSCYAMMLIVNLPMNRLSKSCEKKQGAVIGFDSIEEFAPVNTVMVDAQQIFPAGSIKLRNIKSFFNTSMDEAIVQAASLTHQSGSILDTMFYEIICGKVEMLSPVESYLYEDSMGVCGWINNKRVLLGNRDLMINHSIEGLPSAVKEQEYTKNGRIAVYLSISGQLSAMFIIELVPDFHISEALRDLERRNIAVMLRSVDSMLSVNTLSDLFDVSPSFFRLIPFRYHSEFSQAVGFTAEADAKLACTGSFPSFVQLINGTKTLHTVISLGIAAQAAQILFGILLIIFLILIRNFTELTVCKVLVYDLAFAGAYAIFQRFYKL